MSAGSVELVCERRGARTVVTRNHHAGLARSSRLPGRRDGMAHIMLGTLGPGVLRGDRFNTSGRLGPGASLLVGAQMATPIFPGEPAMLDTRWEIATGATLCLVGQPLVPLPGSNLASVVTIEVAGSGIAIAAETLAVGHDAALRARTIGRIDGTIVVRDVLEVRSLPTRAEAVGSVYAIAANATLRARLTDEAWALADAATDVRAGVGGCNGAVVVRVTGSVFAVARMTAQVAERLTALSLDARA